MHTYASSYCCERALKTDTEERKLVNKVIARSFIILWLNHWTILCHIDYFNDVLTNFLGLECGSCVAVYAGTEISRILSKMFICVPKMNKGTT